MYHRAIANPAANAVISIARTITAGRRLLEPEVAVLVPLATVNTNKCGLKYTVYVNVLKAVYDLVKSMFDIRVL